MRRLLTVLLALAFAAACSPRESAAQQQKKDKLAQLMDVKLRYAKMLLEGLALAKFETAQLSAEKLIQISKTAEWLVHKTPRYEMNSNEFRRAAETIVAKAKEKNIDGVALGYVDLTMSCVRCHQYVREIRDASVRETPRFE